MSTDTESKSVSQAADCTGPAWANNSEYPSITSNEFARDLVLVDQLIQQIEELARALLPLPDSPPRASEAVTLLRTHSEYEEQARTLLANLITYVDCERSIDGRNSEAVRTHSLLAKRLAKLNSAVARAQLFLVHAPEALINEYLDHPRTRAQEFLLAENRKLAATRLSESEETLFEQMRPHGIDAWGNLYSQISTGLRCTLESPDGKLETVGLAEATGVLRESSEPRRRSAWYGIQAAWKTHEESCAAILNGLAGWRLEEYQRRARGQKSDFLAKPIHRARIKRETLDTMMAVVGESREIGQRAIKAMARGFGKKHLDPWDLTAPAPFAAQIPVKRTFKEGLRLVREAFGEIDSSMADFIDTIVKNRWLEGRVLPHKQHGAYCTLFPKSRTPRVFQTFMGSLADIRVLAHELGHAYHAWAMRDLPLSQLDYPMTLAETASIFAETAFADCLVRDGHASVKNEISWQNAESAIGFLLNIPARFDFESSFYERRQSSAYVTAAELGELTETAWRKWYGTTLSETERQYWMTKMHFSFSSISFYNFPYTFGYLYSLGLYARRAELGAGFFPVYRELLRDTGRMSSEELTLRHLGDDLTRPEFWRRCLRIVEAQVADFERLVDAAVKK